MIGENWACPYCEHAQTITARSFDENALWIRVSGCELGDDLALQSIAIACANAKCRKLSLGVMVGKGTTNPRGSIVLNEEIFFQRLMPQSFSKVLPSYIPKAIKDDYEEACAIRDLSPKASATLSRRCLQGMIRDFFGIRKSRLIDEIKELRKQIEAGTAKEAVAIETIDALDHVRELGNIGAHMERDINVIVDVDPGEAQLMIELIETLIDDWYIAREKRKERLAKLKQAADSKKELKKLPASAESQTLLPAPDAQPAAK